MAALLAWLKEKSNCFLQYCLLSVVTFSPFIASNIITSGYVVFPSTSIDVANVDWKYSPALTVNEKELYNCLCEKTGSRNQDEIGAVNKMSTMEWLPAWWQHRSIADKTL